jgi:Putative phage abortive infection protein
MQDEQNLNSIIQDDNKKFERNANYLIYFGALVMFFGIVIFFLPHSFHEKIGSFSEFFGGIVGSVWTLAGVVLFYAALKAQHQQAEIQRQQLEMQQSELRLQRTELKLQRRETELQREEFERQTEQLINQNETLAIQKFENTYFHMLKLHNDIVTSNENLDLGKKWARSLYVRFIGKYQRITERHEDLNKLECINLTYEQFPKRVEYLEKYFNNLIYLIIFIDNSTLDEKQFYINIVRAQLTVHEQLFLFYFVLTKYSKDEFKILIEKYHFFNELPTDELIDSEHKDYYDEKCFE